MSRLLSTAMLAGLLVAPPLVAQDAASHHGDHAGYGSEVFAEGLHLTPEEVAALESGAGARQALPAELNQYPGPRHVLELADSLDLTPAQRIDVEAIRAHMAERAIALGRAVLVAERELSRIFAEGRADEEGVARATAEVARIRGELQAVHLVAHIRTRALLTMHQIHTYDRLRGYGSGHGPAQAGELR